MGNNIPIGLEDGRVQDKITFLEVPERSVSELRAIDGSGVQHSMWQLILSWLGPAWETSVLSSQAKWIWPGCGLQY